MKILFIITRADTIGGAQVHVRDLAQFLVKQNHQVLVVTGVKGIYNEALNRAGIKSIACDHLANQADIFRDWQALSFMVKLICDWQPDLVSTHSSKAGIFGRLASKIASTPCLFTAHGWAFTEGVPQPKRFIYKTIEKLSESLADKIICVSEHDRNLAMQAGMNPQRVVTVHNGMPDIPSSLRSSQADSKLVKVLMVARFDKQKDHPTLIKAFQGINGAELHLVGDGAYLEDSKTLVKDLGIDKKVKFWGFRDNIAEIMAQSDIFTLISHWEGLPRTIIEAMRAGLPIVASAVGGVTELVIEQTTGYCIPRGNIDLLRDRLRRLINDHHLRQTMGNKARERYEQEFTFNHMLQQTTQIYHEVLHQKNNYKEIKMQN